MIARKYRNGTGYGHTLLGLLTQAGVVAFTFLIGIVSTGAIQKLLFDDSNGYKDLFVFSPMMFLCLTIVLLCHVLVYFVWYVTNEKRENVMTFLRKTNIFLWISVIALLSLFMTQHLLAPTPFYHPILLLIIPLFIAGICCLVFYTSTFKVKRLKAEYSDVVNKTLI
jgi:cytochrome bd-type quinol oxidase subunit 2